MMGPVLLDVHVHLLFVGSCTIGCTCVGSVSCTYCVCGGLESQTKRFAGSEGV